MENKSLKEKILYWGGITLISTVIIGGSYYIYQSIFGAEEKENKEKEENENNSLNNSFQLYDSNQMNQNNKNIEINSSNNMNNTNSLLFPKNDNLISNMADNNNNINTNINNNLKMNIIKDEEDVLNEKEEKEEKISNNINIFTNNLILLKSFGINIDESKIIKNNNNKLTDEGIIRLIIYINYLADKFYALDNPSLDEKRRSILIKRNNNNNDLLIEQEYLSLCNETLICKQNAYQIAAEKILNSLKTKVNMDEFDEFVKNIEPKKLEDLTIKVMTELNSQLHKYDLNIMDINKTKEAYIYYLKIFIENAKKIVEEATKKNNIFDENNKNNINTEENNDNMFIFQFMGLKIEMDDQLYEKYKILDEHLKLLVNKYNLFSDNEINQLQNEFDDINKKIGNIKL